MSTTFEFIFELPNVGRGITDDGWEEIDAAHIEYWKEASSLLGSRTFDYRGYSVTLDVDWRPILRRLQRQYRVMQQLDEAAGTPAVHDIIQKFPQTRVKRGKPSEKLVASLATSLTMFGLAYEVH